MGDKGTLIGASIAIGAFVILLIGTGYGLNKTDGKTYNEYKQTDWLGNTKMTGGKSRGNGRGRARRRSQKK
jgi:hypothetical protein